MLSNVLEKGSLRITRTTIFRSPPSGMTICYLYTNFSNLQFLSGIKLLSPSFIEERLRLQPGKLLRHVVACRHSTFLCRRTNDMISIRSARRFINDTVKSTEPQYLNLISEGTLLRKMAVKPFKMLLTNSSVQDCDPTSRKVTRVQRKCWNAERISPSKSIARLEQVPRQSRSPELGKHCWNRAKRYGNTNRPEPGSRSRNRYYFRVHISFRNSTPRSTKVGTHDFRFKSAEKTTQRKPYAAVRRWISLSLV